MEGGAQGWLEIAEAATCSASAAEARWFKATGTAWAQHCRGPPLHLESLEQRVRKPPLDTGHSANCGAARRTASIGKLGMALVRNCS